MKTKHLIIVLSTLTIGITSFFIYLYFHKLSIFDRMPVFSITREISSLETLFTFGNGEGDTLEKPLDIAVDGQGKAYVLDSSSRDIKVYDPNGKFLFSFGKGGDGTEFLLAPSAVAVHKEFVLVSEPTLGRIQAFSKDGTYLKELFKNKDKDTYAPVGMVGIGDSLFFADAAKHRIVEIDLSGKVLSTFGSPGPKEGQLAYPQFLAIDQNNLIYVSDSNNGRVQVFDRNGTYLKTIDGSINNNEKMSLPRGITIDDYNRIIVVDTLANQIRFFELTGEPIFTYGEQGEEDGQLNFPNGIATFGKKVYVADRENHRIQVFLVN